MKFPKFDVSGFRKNTSELSAGIDELSRDNDRQDNELASLQERVADLKRRMGVNLPRVSTTRQVDAPKQLDVAPDGVISLEWGRRDERFDISPLDLAVAVLAGGLAVLVDFVLVKIPRDTTYLGRIKDLGKLEQSGSPLTGWLGTLGHDADGKASSWVRYLEQQFKVGYDTSISPDIDGFSPRTHRMMGAAHDPLLGLFFAILDTKFGTLTAFDRNGRVIIKKIADEAGCLEALAAIITWFGHILSDITTRMGIPIPGWCSLQLLQFGLPSERNRTISDMARYMYLNGYDLRHLLTMTTVPLVVEIVVRIYCLLMKARPNSFLLSEREYTKLKNDIKTHRLLMVAYSIATCGNILKIVGHAGNPLALNIPVWIGFVKEAMAQAKIAIRDSKNFEEAIENRYTIDNNWRFLLAERERNR